MYSVDHHAVMTHFRCLHKTELFKFPGRAPSLPRPWSRCSQEGSCPVPTATKFSCRLVSLLEEGFTYKWNTHLF